MNPIGKPERVTQNGVIALRQVLVNAVAHRSYDDRSRKIFLRIFGDRIEAASRVAGESTDQILKSTDE